MSVSFSFQQLYTRVARISLESIQGEAGVIVLQSNYIKECQPLCKINVLLIADEVQIGIGRIGKVLTFDYKSVQADVLILSKSL